MIAVALSGFILRYVNSYLSPVSTAKAASWASQAAAAAVAGAKAAVVDCGYSVGNARRVAQE